MTNKRTGNRNSRFLRFAAEGQTKGQATAAVDSFASLRNDKQKDRQPQQGRFLRFGEALKGVIRKNGWSLPV
jgi:hypothetical protein